MINTYNESQLHETLKKLYALEFNGLMEVQLDHTPWICDILCQDGNVIEIQTSNLSALTEKIEYILESGRKVKVVHPIALTKWIEVYQADGSLISRKKSPKKGDIFDSLRGMTKICPFFLHENFQLEVLYCEITEKRRKTENPEQNQNKSRRHLKDWLPMGKRLDKIIGKKRFSSKKDWLSLLPAEILSNEGGSFPAPFRTVDLQRAIKNAQGAKKARWANLLIWIFLKMEILEISQIKGRSKFYRLK
ncbi:MAG: hypothetical protein K5873_03530 [Treponema sp.]|nr:hypothetical protein [Treponema sp.]